MNINITDSALSPVQVEHGWSHSVPTITVYQVPAGYRLVIEHVSAMATQDFSGASLYTLVSGVGANHDLSVQPQASADSPGLVSELTRLYADPGTAVSFLGRTTDGNTGRIVISGHLVPIR